VIPIAQGCPRLFRVGSGGVRSRPVRRRSSAAVVSGRRCRTHDGFGLSSSSIIGLPVCGAADALSEEEEDTSVVSFRPGLW
jgi:hypothetical protein